MYQDNGAGSYNTWKAFHSSIAVMLQSYTSPDLGYWVWSCSRVGSDSMVGLDLSVHLAVVPMWCCGCLYRKFGVLPLCTCSAMKVLPSEVADKRWHLYRQLGVLLLLSAMVVWCTSIIQCHESPAEFGFEQKMTSVSSPRPQLSTPSGHLAWNLIDYQHHPRSHHPTLYHPLFSCQHYQH